MLPLLIWVGGWPKINTFANMNKEIKENLDELLQVSKRMKVTDLAINIIVIFLIVYLIAITINQDKRIERLEVQLAEDQYIR